MLFLHYSLSATYPIFLYMPALFLAYMPVRLRLHKPSQLSLNLATCPVFLLSVAICLAVCAAHMYGFVLLPIQYACCSASLPSVSVRIL